jgi:hypothetical protein
MILIAAPANGKTVLDVSTKYKNLYITTLNKRDTSYT